MRYREIGRTGKQAGIIGLGCEHLDHKPYEQVKDTIDAALEGGVNILDVFMPGQEVRENIARALGDKRKDVMIQAHIGSTDIEKQYDISRDLPVIKRYFEDALRIFGGYIDFGMMFFIDSDKDYRGVFETGFADYVRSLKEKGDIGHIGFSSHNPVMAMKVIETGLPEMMMFSINPAFDAYPADVHVLGQLDQGFETDKMTAIDPTRAELYRMCERKGIGITVMKTLGAGKLIHAEHTPFHEPLTVPQCIHYALCRPAVASVMIGCQTGEEVRQALCYLDLPAEELDYTHVLSSLKGDFKGNCVYCNHCQPCPSGIDIAAVNRYLDIAKLDRENIPPSIRSHYESLSAQGGDCIACGSCEAKCPFSVPVIQNMQAAASIFGR